MVEEGKARLCKALIETAVEILQEKAAYAVGEANDCVHSHPSSTTAAALDKLRRCDAYITMYCSNAGRCLQKSAATGGTTDPRTQVELFFGCRTL